MLISHFFCLRRIKSCLPCQQPCQLFWEPLQLTSNANGQWWEHTPRNREVRGSIPAGCWVFLFLSSVMCPLTSPSRSSSITVFPIKMKAQLCSSVQNKNCRNTAWDLKNYPCQFFLPKMTPIVPPSEVKMMECHSNRSFMKTMANEETPIPGAKKYNCKFVIMKLN